MLSGNGTAQQGTWTQNTNQNAEVNVKIPQLLAGSCAFMAFGSKGSARWKARPTSTTR